MAEEWRQVGLAVQATLTEIQTSEEAHGLINSALLTLAMRAEAARRALAGYYEPVDIDVDIDLPDPLMQGVCPTEILADALREVTRLRALLDGAFRAFFLYGEQAGLVPQGQSQGQAEAAHPPFQSWDSRRVFFFLYGQQAAGFVLQGQAEAAAGADLLFLSWDRHRVDALQHANQALWGLRAAASHAEAFKDAFDLAGAGDPRRDEWMMAAHRLAGLAYWEARGALLEVHQIRHAVAMERYEACRVLYNHR